MTVPARTRAQRAAAHGGRWRTRLHGGAARSSEGLVRRANMLLLFDRETRVKLLWAEEGGGGGEAGKGMKRGAALQR